MGYDKRLSKTERRKIKSVRKTMKSIDLDRGDKILREIRERRINAY